MIWIVSNREIAEIEARPLDYPYPAYLSALGWFDWMAERSLVEIDDLNGWKTRCLAAEARADAAEDLKGANLPLYSDRIRNLETRIAELEEENRMLSMLDEPNLIVGLRDRITELERQLAEAKSENLRIEELFYATEGITYDDKLVPTKKKMFAELILRGKEIDDLRQKLETAPHDLHCASRVTKYDPTDYDFDCPRSISAGLPCGCWKSTLSSEPTAEPAKHPDTERLDWLIDRLNCGERCDAGVDGLWDSCPGDSEDVYEEFRASIDSARATSEVGK